MRHTIYICKENNLMSATVSINLKPKITRNEFGEIYFKFAGTEKATGQKVFGIEISAKDKKTAIRDIRNNGYTISKNRLLPSQYFDNVLNNTNGNSWDWEDAVKESDKVLK